MKNITRPRGLPEMRTATSTHIRSAPRHRGTPYLEVLALGMERMRLETEMEMLSKRQRRIEGRLAEIRESIGRLADEVQQKPESRSGPRPQGAGAGADRAREGSSPVPHKWTTMPIEY